jgi:hypothetical protein
MLTFAPELLSDLRKKMVSSWWNRSWRRRDSLNRQLG